MASSETQVDNHQTDRAVAYWLFGIFGMVALMVVVGGVTRLTQSGLSMVDWHPVTGILPPLTEAAWQQAFNDYKAFPQYQKVFTTMTLTEFKSIFFWEYVHRILGRLVGLAFFFPWLYFMIRGRMTLRMTLLTGVALCLGGLQGFMGWYMVQSGLVDNPAVSHYRLAAHLSLAFICAMFVLSLALSILPGPDREGHPMLRRWTLAFSAILILQIVYGAFMAGTRAGYMYQTFPLMNGSLLPETSWTMAPVWLNFLENLDMINVMHRSLGWLVLAGGIALGVFGLKAACNSLQLWSSRAVLGMISLQFLLGVAVVLAPGVPVWLGVTHQIGAFFLASLIIVFFYAFGSSDESTSLAS